MSYHSFHHKAMLSQNEGVEECIVCGGVDDPEEGAVCDRCKNWVCKDCQRPVDGFVAEKDYWSCPNCGKVNEV